MSRSNNQINRNLSVKFKQELLDIFAMLFIFLCLERAHLSLTAMLITTHLKPSLSFWVVLLHDSFFLSPYLVFTTLLGGLKSTSKRQANQQNN